LRTKRQL